MKVYIVLKNADFNEGRGPMLLHKVFGTFKAAENYVMKQQGIFGSSQYKEKSPLLGVYYNGYDIREREVEQ